MRRSSRTPCAARFRLEAAQARLDERRELDDLQLVCEGSRIDAGEFEEVLDEPGEPARLLL